MATESGGGKRIPITKRAFLEHIGIMAGIGLVKKYFGPRSILSGPNNSLDRSSEAESEQRKQDIQTFREVVSKWILPDDNKEAFAKFYSDDFINQKLLPTPEEPQPVRLSTNRGKQNVYINPQNLTEQQEGESISYSVRTAPTETSEQRLQIPALSYSKSTYQGNEVEEIISGIADPEGKLIGQQIKGIDPQDEDEREYDAEDLKNKIRKIFKFTDQQWGQFSWDINGNVITSTDGYPSFAITGIMEEEGKRYRLFIGKAGNFGLFIDHRPKNFGFTEENYRR